jgi:hypothetical protein
MAFRFPKQPVTAPFFKVKAAPKAKPSAEKKRERAAPGHLDKIRLLPCCACGRPGPSTAHHLKAGRGSMTKAPNSRALPLCWDDHVGPQGVESAGTRNEEAWFADRGVRPFELAAALHQNNHSIVSMLKVLLAHKGKTR